MRRARRGAAATLHAALAVAAGLATLPASGATGAQAPPLPDRAADLDGRALLVGMAATAVNPTGLGRATQAGLAPASAFGLTRPDEAGCVPRRPRRAVPRGIERPIPALPRPRMHGSQPGPASPVEAPLQARRAPGAR